MPEFLCFSHCDCNRRLDIWASSARHKTYILGQLKQNKKYYLNNNSINFRNETLGKKTQIKWRYLSRCDRKPRITELTVKDRRYWSTCRQPWHMQAHGRSAARHRVQVDARFWENISQRECDDSFISPEISYKTSRYKKDQIISCMWFNLKCLSPLTLYYLYFNSKKKSNYIHMKLLSKEIKSIFMKLYSTIIFSGSFLRSQYL